MVDQRSVIAADSYQSKVYKEQNIYFVVERASPIHAIPSLFVAPTHDFVRHISGCCYQI